MNSESSHDFIIVTMIALYDVKLLKLQIDQNCLGACLMQYP